MNYYQDDRNMANRNGGIVTSPDNTINTPPETDMNTEAFMGSMQQILSDNVGKYVVVEFLIGTQQMSVREGYIYNVGRSFLVLYDHRDQRYIICDIFSVKFVTFPVPPSAQYRGDMRDFPFPPAAGSMQPRLNGRSASVMAAPASAPAAPAGDGADEAADPNISKYTYPRYHR